MHWHEIATYKVDGLQKTINGKNALSDLASQAMAYASMTETISEVQYELV